MVETLTMQTPANGFRTLKLLIASTLMAAAFAACGGSGDTDYPSSAPQQPGSAEAPSAGVQISIEAGAAGRGSAAFGINPREVPFGATVVWTNNDSVPHTVTSNDGAFDSGEIKPGGTYSHTFTRSGTYGYFCTIHGMGSMSGVIEVQ
jgi:plastocyanin